MLNNRSFSYHYSIYTPCLSTSINTTQCCFWFYWLLEIIAVHSQCYFKSVSSNRISAKACLVNTYPSFFVCLLREQYCFSSQVSNEIICFMLSSWIAVNCTKSETYNIFNFLGITAFLKVTFSNLEQETMLKYRKLSCCCEKGFSIISLGTVWSIS